MEKHALNSIGIGEGVPDKTTSCSFLVVGLDAIIWQKIYNYTLEYITYRHRIDTVDGRNPAPVHR